MVDDKIAGWLHDVELTPGSERQEAIASAAKAYAGSASPAALPDLILLAHGIPAGDAHRQVTSAVAAHDPTYAAGSDELETHLAAAVMIAAVMERNSLAATTAASLVLNAAATGLVSAIAELPALAAEARHRRGGAIRARVPIKSSLDTRQVFAAVPAFDQDGTQVFHQDIRPLRASSLAALEATAKALGSLASKLSSRLDAADEELDLLWWCFTGRSEILDQRWTSLASSGLAAVVAAIEMERHLAFPAEPQSARSLLAKALGDHADKTVQLQAAINAAGEVEMPVEVADGHQLLPVLSSLREYGELEGKPAWKTSVRRWGIDPGRRWSALDLAGECLREIIVLRTTG